ncbi:MAG TPA: DUF362 domain-containing protein [Clostridia bacterium]|nr:DUF362 domain-containing protein [Clostridia bacterium]
MNLGVVSVNTYERDEVTKAVDELFNQLGGITKYVPKNKKVFVKANLVRDMPPEKCGTTHPEVVIAVVKKLIDECQAEVTVGDSSGGGYTKTLMGGVFRATKMDYACAESGAKLIDDFGYQTVDIDGVMLHKLDVTNSFLDADVVINIGKLKTHSFTGFTGCVKNLYGLIPGLIKVEVHAAFPNLEQFTDVLIDIERYASPKIALHILDAVYGMEGDGPTNGKPKFIGKLIASPNAYLADVAGVSLFADPKSMPLIKKAIKRGIISEDFCESEYDLTTLTKEYIEDFDRIKVFSVNFKRNMPKWFARFIRNSMSPKVRPSKRLCKGCQKCYHHCPAKAITMVKKIAVVDQVKCIRCYCCQELCPHDAVKLHKPIVYRFARLVSKGKSAKKTKK